MNGDLWCCILITSSGNSREDRAPNMLVEAMTETPFDSTSQIIFSVPEPTISGICTFFFFFLFSKSVSISCGHGKEITLQL